jgi:hypothetical protein
MRIATDFGGAGAEIRRSYPIYASADAVKGAGFILGATPGTDGGCVILATGACADFFGILNEEYDYSEEGSSVVGSSEVTKEFVINPFGVYEIEYDLTDTMAATHAADSTALTLTNLEDNIDGAFLYVVSGDAIGQLRSLTASGAGSCTLKTAYSPALAVADTLVKILPRGHGLAKLNSAATKIGTDVAAGSAVVRIVESWIKRKNQAKEVLAFSKHSGLSGLDDLGVIFSSYILFRDSAFNTID